MNIRICTFPDCDKPHAARGYCFGHYSQLNRGKKLTPLHKRGPSVNRATCSAYGCEMKSVAKEFCAKHYARFKRHGDPSVNYRPSRKSKCDASGGPRKNYAVSSDERSVVNDYVGLDTYSINDY